MQPQPPGPDPSLRIELFGGLRVYLNGKLVTKFRTRKTASLLGYLAFNAETPQHRDVLIEVFWPEATVDAGRQSLRMALSALRETLQDSAESPKYLETDRNTVRLTNVTTDVEEFMGASTGTDGALSLTTALKKVKGPLLAGFDESWIVAQWLSLEEAYAQAAIRLMQSASAPEDRMSAILAGKEAVALLGPREDVHVALMRLFAEDGQTGQAIAQFEALEKSLDEQWGESPSDQAYAALDSLPRGAAKTVPRQAQIAVPARASELIGREEETTLVVSLLSQGKRLVTLTGPGGTGKTALAVVAARSYAESVSEVAWMVELASVTEPGRLGETVFLGVTGNPPQGPVGTEDLVDAIGSQPALLILDNLEQLLPEAAVFTASLLKRLPGLKVLVTSRSWLNVDGEHVVPVSLLPVPEPGLKLGELSEVPSVALFVARAKSVQHDFKLQPDNAAAVAEICRRLEGLPLAIELAAARLSTFSPAQILSRLACSLDFLVSRRVDVDERHRSLRGTLDWSLSLIPRDVADTFARLGVFKGSFDIDGAEAAASEPQVDRQVDHLVGTSLLLSEPFAHGTRFRMLVPVRDYARERLSEAGQEREAVRGVYAYCLGLGQGKGTGTPGPGNVEWLDRLDAEHENLVAVFESADAGHISVVEAFELARTIRSYFKPRGRVALWTALMQDLYERHGRELEPKQRLDALLATVKTSNNVLTADQIWSYYSEAASLEAHGSDRDKGEVHSGLAGAHKSRGEYAAAAKEYELATEYFEKAGDIGKLAATMRQHAMNYVSMRDHEMSYATLKKTVPLARQAGDVDALAWSLTDLAIEHAMHGLAKESEECFAEAHDICRRTGNKQLWSVVYWQQAEAALRTGDPAVSVAIHKDSVRKALEASFEHGLKWILLSLGCAYVQSGDLDRGLAVLAKVTRWRADENRKLTGDEEEILDPAMEKLKAGWTDGGFERAWSTAETADLQSLLTLVLDDS